LTERIPDFITKFESKGKKEEKERERENEK